MDEFFIRLLCGIIAFLVIMYCFFKSLKKCDEIDTFIRTKMNEPLLADMVTWLHPFIMLYMSIEIIQHLVYFIDPSIKFE